MTTRHDVPPFEPHPLLPTGHLQTIMSRYLFGLPARLDSVDHTISLADSDRLLVHDSTPDGWQVGRPMVLLVHGLGGDAEGVDLVTLARRMVGLGIRALRMNLRGAGGLRPGEAALFGCQRR